MSHAAHRKEKSVRRNAVDVAFHLRNAGISLERLERQPRTAEQDVAAAALRRALNVAHVRGDALVNACPPNALQRAAEAATKELR